MQCFLGCCGNFRLGVGAVNKNSGSALRSDMKMGVLDSKRVSQGVSTRGSKG